MSKTPPQQFTEPPCPQVMASKPPTLSLLWTLFSRTQSSASSSQPSSCGPSRPCSRPSSTTRHCWSLTGPSGCPGALAPTPRAMGTQQGAYCGQLELWVLTSAFLQVGGKPDHDDQSLHIPDLHGADSALPRPHQVPIATSCPKLRVRVTSGEHSLQENGNGIAVDANS